MEDLGVPAGFVGSRGFGVSSDGQFVCGTALSSNSSRAFRWTRATGCVDLGSIQDMTSAFGTGISDDGRVVAINTVLVSGRTRGAVWTAGEGIQSLETLSPNRSSSATGVSGDGSTICGSAQNASYQLNAALWEFGDSVENFESLWPEGGPLFSTINQNATAGAGWILFPQAETHAMRWTRLGGLEDLGRLPEANASLIVEINHDASVLVGYSIKPTGNRATIWTPTIGLSDLNDVFRDGGLDLSGWVLTSAEDITPDGDTIVGEGLYNGQRRAWLARGVRTVLPCAADFNRDGFVDFFDYQSFVECFEDDICPAASADFNRDGFVDFFDYAAFVGAFEAGC